MLTPRENFIAFFKGEPYEWTPSRFDCKPFMPQEINENIVRGLVAQQQPYTGAFGGTDPFGVEWIYDPVSGGSMDAKPLFEDIEDWEDYFRLPDLDAIDWEGCAGRNAEYLKTDKLLFTLVYTGFFERIISFVGFENAAVAMIDEEQQDCVRAIFDKLADHYIEFIRRLRKYFGIEHIVFHDDWGTQISTIISPEAHRVLIMPYIKRVVDACHGMGVYFEQHSCGKNDTLAPNIIESGADTWIGQSICDKEQMFEQYGDRFRFGVLLEIPEPVSDEEALRRVKELLDHWKGRNICFKVEGKVSPEQAAKLERFNREYGR